MQGVALADALGMKYKVSLLYMRNNIISDAGGAALAETLEVSDTVQELSLNYNKIGDAGYAALPEALKMNTWITAVDLYHSQFGDAGCKALADQHLFFGRSRRPTSLFRALEAAASKLFDALHDEIIKKSSVYNGRSKPAAKSNIDMQCYGPCEGWLKSQSHRRGLV